MQSWEETQTISLPIHTLLMGTLTTSEGASLGFGGPGLLNWQNLTVTASGGCVYGGALMAPERRNLASPSSAAAVCTAAGSFQKCSQFYHCHLTPSSEHGNPFSGQWAGDDKPSCILHGRKTQRQNYKEEASSSKNHGDRCKPTDSGVSHLGSRIQNMQAAMVHTRILNFLLKLGVST